MVGGLACFGSLLLGFLVRFFLLLSVLLGRSVLVLMRIVSADGWISFFLL